MTDVAILICVYLIVFGPLAVVLIVVAVGKNRANKVKEATLSVTFDDIDADAPSREFDYTCEYCGGTVHSTMRVCPHCGGSVFKNKEYITRKRINSEAYLAYLARQKAAIAEQARRINERITYAQTHGVMKRRYFALDEWDLPDYMPAMHYDFGCDYCGAHVQIARADIAHPVCSNCGADASGNLELRCAMERDALGRFQYDEYERIMNRMTDFNTAARRSNR